jgi:predicted DNA-binding transcriptional regulator AlpA
MNQPMILCTPDQISEQLREAVRTEFAAVVGTGAKEVLNISGVGELLDRSRPTVMKLTERERDPLPCHHISEREPRFIRSEVLAWLARQPRRVGK